MKPRKFEIDEIIQYTEVNTEREIMYEKIFFRGGFCNGLAFSGL